MQLKIISTKEIVFESQEIESLSTPTQAGRIQILPNHANLITALDIGMLSVVSEGKKQDILISGGFMVVKENSILVLADEANKPEELVKQEIQQAINDAQAKLENTTSPSELIQLEKQLRYERFKYNKAL